MSHTPDVLRDLQTRLRRAPSPRRRADLGPETFSTFVHEIPQEELEAAYRFGVLDLDREATRLLAAGGPW